MNRAIPAAGIRDPRRRIRRTGWRARSCRQGRQPRSAAPVPAWRGNSRCFRAGRSRRPTARQLVPHAGTAWQPRSGYASRSRRIPAPPCPRTRGNSTHRRQCRRPRAPACRPSPVTALTPLLGDACSTSWPRDRSNGAVSADQARPADNNDLHVSLLLPNAAADPARHPKTSGKAPL